MTDRRPDPATSAAPEEELTDLLADLSAWLRAAHAASTLDAIHDEAGGLLDLQFVMNSGFGAVFEAELAGVEDARPLAQALRYVITGELVGEPATCLRCGRAVAVDYGVTLVRSQAPEPKAWLALTACDGCAPGLDELRALVVAALAQVMRLRPIHQAVRA